MGRLNEMMRAPSTLVALFVLVMIGTYFGLKITHQPDQAAVPARAGVVAAPPPTVTGAVPNHHPTITDQDFERRFAEAFERASKPAPVAPTTTTARDTTQPLRRAPVHVVHFDRAALPAPVLDGRQRECIGYTLNTGFTRVRYNLLLQPNMYVVSARNWSNPQWLATFRVEAGTFPVNLWRVRDGMATFWKQVRVEAGPGLPIGNPQVALSGEFFRGGDVLCVEAVRAGGPLFVAYDQQTGLVVQPQLSAIQNASNDSTPVPGAWTTISAKVVE